MTAETASPTAPEKVPPPELVQQDHTIQRRIDRTRSHVKLVELATAWTQLAAGVLVFLLLVTLVDHWAMGLTLGLRLTALILLLVGCAAFCIWRLVPSLTRPVNPVYAARAIEQAVPSLKNSLINFLLLRARRDSLRPVIYAGVQRQAAEDLTSVDVDSAVDRSELIHFGYLLAAVVVLFGVYKVTSPKDPFQSVARVIMPWKPIPRPSRVQIRQVSPGAAEVYRGTVLDVTALVDGLKDDEAVRLCYSTEDRQTVNHEILLQRSATDPRFRGQLTTGEFGIQDPLVYHLRAGDARTADYRVLLKEAPSISLQSIEYRYPKYTGWADEKIIGQGDLKALEGTQVRLEGLANQSIRSAYLELLTPNDLATSGDAPAPSKAVPIKSEGQRAWGQITLKLQADRRSPQYAAYRIRFLNQQGQRNVEPAQYRIDVTPDLPPLVEIVSPRRRDIELPANLSLPIEVRALDPDFALQRVTLQAIVGTQEVVQQALLDEPRQGQVVQPYEFVPRRLGLAAGDVVLYWATAEDNRMAVGSQAAAPNRQRTEDYRIRIVSADRPPDEAPNDKPQDTAEQDDSQQDKSQRTGEAGDSEQPTSEDAQAGSEEQSPQDDSAAETGGEGSASDGGGESGESTGEAGDGEGSQPDGEGTEPTREDTQPGSEDAQPTGEGAQPSDADDRAESHSPTDGNRGQPVGEPSDGSSSESGEPVASDGSNDSDAFERILDHMREQQPEPTDDADDTSSAGDAKTPDPSAPDNEASQPSSPTDNATERTEQAAPASDDTSEQMPGSRSESPDERSSPPTDVRQPSPSEGEEAAERTGASGSEKERPPAGSPPAERSPEMDSASPDGSASQAEGASQPPRGSDDSGSQVDGPQTDADGVKGSQPGEAAEAERSTGEPDRQQEPSNGSGQPGQTPTTANDPDSPPSGEGSLDGSGASPVKTAEGDPADSPTPPGGQPATGEATTETAADGEAQADDANLQFAREATDLALEHLRDQQDDPRLLERLGWTPEEAEAFLQRWQQMQREASQQSVAGQQARRQLDDQLRGLGLRPNDATVRRDVTTPDGFRGLMEGGGRSAPPAEYRDQNRAFLRSFSRPADE